MDTNNLFFVDLSSTVPFYYFLIYKTDTIDMIVNMSEDEFELIAMRNSLIQSKVCNLSNLRIIKYENILYNGINNLI